MAGRIPKWPTGADCKSAGLRLRWFESSSYHHPFFRVGALRAAPRHVSDVTSYQQRPRANWIDSVFLLTGLAAVAVFFQFGETAFDELIRLLGKTLFLDFFALVLISCGYFGWRAYDQGQLQPKDLPEKEEEEEEKVN